MSFIHASIPQRKGVGLLLSENFVHQFYEMNPETDVLLPDGSYLRNGMKVLIESFLLREELGSGMTLKNRVMARITNRWCVVRNVAIIHGGGAVSFVGVYEDGLKAQRIVEIEHAWLVKEKSIPDSM